MCTEFDLLTRNGVQYLWHAPSVQGEITKMTGRTRARSTPLRFLLTSLSLFSPLLL